MSDDTYPSASGRRRFVKGVVGSAALSGVGVGASASVDLSTQPAGGGGGTTEYVGITRLAGPAPRGMPYIPVEIDDDGDIRGVWPETEQVTEDGATFLVAETEIGGRTYSTEWFQYCGRQNADGVKPDTETSNYFHSVSAGDADYEWQADALSEGDRLNVEHFSDYETWGNGIGTDGAGKPAQATWRSQGLEGVLPVTIIRSKRIEKQAERNDAVGRWYADASSQGVIAFLNVCTHFCCTPKGYKISEDATGYEATDIVYCQCHQSRYDPFSPEFGAFVSLPRPDD